MTDRPSPRPPRRRLRARVVVSATIAFAIVFGGFAWAATTPTAAGGLATSRVDADCQSTTIDTGWEYGYDATIPGYRITSVVLDGLEPGCLGKGVSVAVAGTGGTEVASGSGITPSTGTSATVALSNGPDLSDPWVGQLSVVIHS